MTKEVEIDIADAQFQLPRLADLVWSGGRVVITKMGKPYLDLLPYRGGKHQRTPGSLKEKIVIKPGFDDIQGNIIDFGT